MVRTVPLQRFYCILALLTLTFITPGISHAGDITVRLSTDKSTYLPGQSVNFLVYAIYGDGKPVISVSNKEISLKDPAGAVVLKTSLASKGNGYFSYSYPLKSTARTGSWQAKATIKDTYGSDGEISGYFKVESKVAADTTAPVTTAAPAGGSFTAPVTVTLTRNESGTTYYTLDGSTPTTASTVYGAPLTLSASTVLKFFSRDTAGNIEAVKSVSFTIAAT